MSRGKGFGIANYRIHKELEGMAKKERIAFELKLKNNTPKMYDEFKEWQDFFMEVFPERKIDY